MKLLALRCVIVACCAAGVLAGEAAEGKFRPGEVWRDDHGVAINAHGGGMLLHAGAYYWFGEHKVAGEAGNRAQVGVHCYSSRDLYAWKDEGIALAVSDDPASDIVRGCIIERPKVIHNPRTGKFVMWFHLELKDQGYKAARTAVAVADAVTGPYRYVRSVRPNAGQEPIGAVTGDGEGAQACRRDLPGGQMARDMTLFVDDDGKAYHVHSSEENWTLHIAELTDDYLDFSGRYARVLPEGKNEAPALFKRNGRYYLLTSGCSGWKPNAARSAVADSIWGPWIELGNPCVAGAPAGVPGAELTYGGQSTYVLPVAGRADAYIAMFDIWRPENSIDGRYMWLPVEFSSDGNFYIPYRAEWDLAVFAEQP